MSIRETAWPAGTPCWMELRTSDVQAAQTFYGALFGWDVQDMGADFNHYCVARLEGHRVGALASAADDDSRPPAWATYLATDDADQTAAAITAAGGGLAFPVHDVPGQGRFTMANDPTGAEFGVWQAQENIGSALSNQPGAYAWNECMSRDFAAAQEFYTAVFGYGWMDLSGGGFTYATMTVDGRPVGGLGGLPADVPADLPSHWMGYFKVADCDASAALVVSLGGSVQREPWDTPFGRMATVADGQGAVFSLMADTEESIANAAQVGAAS